MAPIDINNQEISSITLNGNTDIDTVEVNGQTVFSAGPVNFVDDFDSNTLSIYDQYFANSYNQPMIEQSTWSIANSNVTHSNDNEMHALLYNFESIDRVSIKNTVSSYGDNDYIGCAIKRNTGDWWVAIIQLQYGIYRYWDIPFPDAFYGSETPGSNETDNGSINVSYTRPFNLTLEYNSGTLTFRKDGSQLFSKNVSNDQVDAAGLVSGFNSPAPDYDAIEVKFDI